MRLLTFILTVWPMLAQTPIVFVHGNGDDAAKWMGIIWLFESNGYPREHLRAVRLSHPAARADDSKPSPNRSSTTDQAAELASFVTRTLIETGAKQVALVGSSRGGNVIRNYLKFGGGRSAVSHAVLCGTPNHGVFRMDANRSNEFNGIGDFLQKLNSGSEVIDEISFMTLRSDRFDKYAQPQGAGYESPELKGAKNVVLPGLDHREVAFHPQAFAAMYEFLTGRRAQRLTVAREESVRLSGVVTGYAAGAPTNLPEPGVYLKVRDHSTESIVWEGLVPETGWGPISIKGGTVLEFLLEKDGNKLRYFRSSFERSSDLVNLRWTPEAPKGKVTVARPQGYFSKARDKVVLDGVPVVEVPAGLPSADRFVLTLVKEGWLELRGEKVPVQPAKENEAVVVEFLWE